VAQLTYDFGMSEQATGRRASAGGCGRRPRLGRRSSDISATCWRRSMEANSMS